MSEARFYLIPEKHINSLRSLLENLETLELDEGIRFEGRLDGKQCVFFIAKPASNYVIAAYRKGTRGDGEPIGERLLFKEFQNLHELQVFLEGLSPKPSKAFRY
ncbi:MAG: hypothetical protein QW767_01540 [Thermoprotei archaeon]